MVKILNKVNLYFLYSIVISLILLSNSAKAQVGGVCDSKISTISSEIVEKKKMEFEPGIAFNWVNKTWNENGDLQTVFDDKDSLKRFAEMGYRFTYGLLNKLEMGVTIDQDISLGAFGFKWNCFSSKSFDLATIGGINIPFKPENYTQRLALEKTTPSLAAGVVVSYFFNQSISLDFDSQYQRYTKETYLKHNYDFFVNSDFGIYLNKELQLATGINYTKSDYEDPFWRTNSTRLNIGGTIETGENFVIILKSFRDLLGENTFRSTGFAITFTFTVV